MLYLYHAMRTSLSLGYVTLTTSKWHQRSKKCINKIKIRREKIQSINIPARHAENYVFGSVKFAFNCMRRSKITKPPHSPNSYRKSSSISQFSSRACHQLAGINGRSEKRHIPKSCFSRESHRWKNYFPSACVPLSISFFIGEIDGATRTGR